MFYLPRLCLGSDLNAADLKRVADGFLPWLRAFANSRDGAVRAVETPAGLTTSFDAFELAGQGLWILHNRFTSLVGGVKDLPRAGFAYAVDAEFVSLEVPSFLQSWGPVVPTPKELHSELTSQHWQHLTISDRTYADKFKPTQVSHVLFNYWD